MALSTKNTVGAQWPLKRGISTLLLCFCNVSVEKEHMFKFTKLMSLLIWSCCLCLLDLAASKHPIYSNQQIFQPLFSYHSLIGTENSLKRLPWLTSSVALTKTVVFLRRCDLFLFLKAAHFLDVIRVLHSR